MAIIEADCPTDKEIEWLAHHVGERMSYLPHYIGGKGWRFRRDRADRKKWSLEFDDDKMASYYILKFK